MAAETALPFLRRLEGGRFDDRIVLVFGPQTFLREFILQRIRTKLSGKIDDFLSFQVGAGDDFSAVVEELNTPGLFAGRKLILCRVLRGRREQGGEEEETRVAPRAGSESSLIAALERLTISCVLVLLYERDNAPAKVRRAAEALGASVLCMRPFENQIGQYARVWARTLGVQVDEAAIEQMAERHGEDLGAIYNELCKAALYDSSAAANFLETEQGRAGRAPEIFVLAESIASGQGASAAALMGRAFAVGRDPVEILAVEIIPVLRRITLAASLLLKRTSIAEIGREMGMNPNSPLVGRAIDAARRLGYRRVEACYRHACDLDARFKAGMTKERAEALSSLLLDLFEPAR